MKLYSQLLSPHITAPEAEATPLVEMNTTPLIDVLLVLIVMLIITIPVPLHSVNLDMPSRQQATTVPEVVVLQIDAKGFVVWGGDSLANMADVNAHIAAAAAAMRAFTSAILTSLSLPHTTKPCASIWSRTTSGTVLVACLEGMSKLTECSGTGMVMMSMTINTSSTSISGVVFISTSGVASASGTAICGDKSWL